MFLDLLIGTAVLTWTGDRVTFRVHDAVQTVNTTPQHVVVILWSLAVTRVRLVRTHRLDIIVYIWKNKSRFIHKRW